jgi:hypothetical protein
MEAVILISEVFMVPTTKFAVFWDVTPRSLMDGHGHFGGTAASFLRTDLNTHHRENLRA